jgi:hypothetical protein
MSFRRYDAGEKRDRVRIVERGSATEAHQTQLDQLHQLAAHRPVGFASLAESI